MSISGTKQERRPAKVVARVAAGGAGGIALIAAHLYVRSLPITEATPLVLLDHVFNLALVVLVLGACRALGVRLLGLIGCTDLEALPRMLTAVALGLGVLAYAVFALGVAGLFRSEVLGGLTAALLLATARDQAAILAEATRGARRAVFGFRSLQGQHRLLVLLGCFGFLVALPVVLAPPTDYDGLMYHLYAPAKFLQAGRIYPMPDLVQANFPFTAEMVYSLGLALGSDVFGRLLNLILWGVLASGTWWLGRRYLSDRTGILAFLLLLTAPGAYLASSTCVEMLWAFLTLVSVTVFFQWRESGRDRWLVVLGILGGLVLGTKELAFGTPAAIGAGAALHLLFSRRAGLRGTIVRLAFFSATVLVVGAPWYLKNWLWLESPLYPLFTQADEWARYYLTTAGNPKTLTGLLTLPVAIFFPPNEWTFSAAMPSYFFLPFSFLALPAVALAPWKTPVKYLLLFAGVFFAAWGAGYQLVRFLYPAFPVFALLVAHGLAEATVFGRRLPHRWAPALVSPFLAVSIALQMVLLIAIRPMGVVAGAESADAFLANSAALPIYRGVSWANQHLARGSNLFLVATGEAYYFRTRVLPDSTASNMQRLFSQGASDEEAIRRLRKGGFTHVFFAPREITWHLSYRDPDGSMVLLAARMNELLRNHGTPIYEDDWARIYELDSP